MIEMSRKDEYNSFENQLLRFRAAIEFLERSGITVGVTSRLRTYEHRLERVTIDPNPSVPAALVDQVTFDLREIDEISEIAESFDREPSEAEMLRLRQLPKGHEDPDHRGNQRARDAQYELFLRAVLVADGRPVHMSEPDLIVPYDEAAIQIAAKRPASAKRLDDRLRSAVSQVERRSETAVIAISLDHVIRPRGGLLSVPSMPELGAGVTALVSDFLAGWVHSLARRVRERHVDAIIFTTRIPGRTQDTNHSVLGTSLQVEMLAPADSKQVPLLHRFLTTIGTYLT